MTFISARWLLKRRATAKTRASPALIDVHVLRNGLIVVKHDCLMAGLH